MMSLEFVKNKKKFSLNEKRLIAEKAVELRTELKKNAPKPFWSDVKRKWVYPSTQVGFKALTVRSMFSDMADALSDSKDFKNAIKLVERSLSSMEAGDFDKDGNSGSNRYFNKSFIFSPFSLFKEAAMLTFK